ncbi:MAG: S8 family serine peptidase [Xanthomonadales bacterium]|nr:S8 family serine peptidase [Gammaproteobacteria bacterium]NNK52334.1 S8 family serine peptidase [Xanthomonadales bacterium]
MKLQKTWIFFITLGLAGQVFAQNSVAIETRQTKLRALAATLQQRDATDLKAVEAFARSAGISKRRELPNGGALELQRIAPGIGPVFYVTNNILAAQTVSTDKVWPGGPAGLSLDGSGMTMAQWDFGAVDSEHVEFTGRVTQADVATNIRKHSTHVAGTLIGAGLLYLDLRGMAYSAELDAYDWNSDTAEMAGAAANGQLVSNHSYGIAAGWVYTGATTPPDTWWWFGGADPAIQEDPNFGYYDSESQLWDQIAFDAPYYLIVKAAGNDRTDIGPAEGEEYTIVDQEGEFVSTSTAARNPDCWPGGYDCLPTNSVAKNILTIGAVDDLPGGYLPLGGPQQVVMADFSGWGPTDDGRIKPDLVGNGVFLFSAWPDPPYFAAAAGTSMAAPNVSGSLLLLQQHYQQLNGPGNFLRAATLKALAIHSADEAGAAPGPDYAFGWGLLNTLSAANVISGDGTEQQIIENSLANSETDARSVSVTSPDAVLKATLVWADPPGSPPAPALDPADLMLVNDLDLRISRGGNEWLPWVLDPANPAAAATTGDNIRDNVEQVKVNSADTCAYTVRVAHKGTLLNSQKQEYSLIISVEAPPPAGVFLIEEDFTGGMPAGWSVDTTEGVSWTVNSPVEDDPRLDNLTGGAGNFAMVNNNFSNQTETSLVSPVLDLSAIDDAVLRFSSGYGYDEAESINVDVSNDGGENWSNVWIFQGFNPLPSRYVVDLSTISGETNARLRFRFDSNGGLSGDFWQVDDIELEIFEALPAPESLPAPAIEPSPPDGASDVGLSIELQWTAGSQSDSHNVYFGTANPLGPGDLHGNQTGTSLNPGPLVANTTYYWRVDEVNAEGSVRGCTWSFKTSAEMQEVLLKDGFE